MKNILFWRGPLVRSSLLQLAVLLPAFLIGVSGVLPDAAAGLLVWASQIAVLVYEWFVVRTALRLPGFGAAGIVVIDVLLDLIIQKFGDIVALAG